MVKILLIGEAYGRTEDEYQHGFTGSSGIELAQMLHEAKITHNFDLFCSKCSLWSNFPQCHTCSEPLYPSAKDMIRHWKEIKNNYDIEITNVFEFHPPNNDLGYIFTPEKNSFMPGYKYHQKRPISYVQPQYHKHLHILWERIKKDKPNICILLGNTACWAILRQTNIQAIRGTIIQSEYLGNKCLATWHPANILREWPNRVVTIADLQKAYANSKFPEIRRRKRKTIIHATLEEIQNWFLLPSDRYTIDIESGYALFTTAELKNMTQKMRYTLSSQISMISFARNLEDNLCIEFMTRNKSNLSYWNTQAEEVQAWKLVKRELLSSIPKTFQNGVYDMTRLASMGLLTHKAKDDPMLLHHSLYPEMRKSLGFLASFYADESPWKLMYSKGESLKRDE